MAGKREIRIQEVAVANPRHLEFLEKGYDFFGMFCQPPGHRPVDSLLYFFKPADQFVTTVSGGDAAPELSLCWLGIVCRRKWCHIEP